MAFSLNRAQIIGNVTRDPDIRVAGTQKVATFGIATNLSWMDKATGQRKEKVEFHNVVAWRNLAEVCEKYLRKGTKVFVEGRLQTRDWEGEDGVKRYKTEIVIENMIMLDKKGEMPTGATGAAEGDGASSFQPVRQQRAVKEQAAAAPQEEEVSMDDLPF